MRRAQQYVLRNHVSRLIQTSALRLYPNPEPAVGHLLDPELKQLLRDTDLALLKSRKKRGPLPTYPKAESLEIEVIPKGPAGAPDDHGLSEEPVAGSDQGDILASHIREEKRSAEARFGSKHIGLSVIPTELENAISSIIEESDKHQLRSDAKRLFLKSSPSSSYRFEDKWTSELPDKFKESRRRKSARITPREALTYTTIAMPAQYAAIRNVLEETRTRLGQQWASQVSGLIDFGSGTGTALWASLDAFRCAPSFADTPREHSAAANFPVVIGGPSYSLQTSSLDPGENGDSVSSGPLTQSSIQHYLLLENRVHLLAMSKKLTKDISYGSTRVQVEKYWGKEGHKMHSKVNETVAIMAFTLSDLPTDQARRAMLREMWHTGAETMIVIDQGNEDGFKHISYAREYLLGCGRDTIQKNTDGAGGCYVVAPCPHDEACPMTVLTKTYGVPQTCYFSQRVERPAFLRHTKHAGRNHEDIHYSYIVVQRGTRPKPPVDTHIWDPVTKLSHNEKRAFAQKKKGKEVMKVTVVNPELVQDSGDDGIAAITLETSHEPGCSEETRQRGRSDEAIRSESFYWQRIIRPPLKRSGHVIMETCTKDGNIARHTIPKSQGKQPYYDARKARWGDAFPWQSKNGAEIRRRGRPLDNTKDIDHLEDIADDTPLDEINGEWEVSFGPDGQPITRRIG